jgi:5-methylcytosine-specific restriction endonuclease McrA
MRIPSNMSLASYIMKLIKQDKIVMFYKSKDWIELKAEVLEELHNECQECLKHGKYTHADVVHHCLEVRQHPELALSKYYTDKDGQKQRQLVPLCHACHSIVHDKLGHQQREKNAFTNEERW